MMIGEVSYQVLKFYQQTLNKGETNSLNNSHRIEHCRKMWSATQLCCDIGGCACLLMQTSLQWCIIEMLF